MVNFLTLSGVGVGICAGHCQGCRRAKACEHNLCLDNFQVPHQEGQHVGAGGCLGGSIRDLCPVVFQGGNQWGGRPGHHGHSSFPVVCWGGH